MADNYSLHGAMMAGCRAKIEAENGKKNGTGWKRNYSPMDLVPMSLMVNPHSLVDSMICLSKQKGQLILQVIEHCCGNP
jgi:hypothetical protein